MTKIDLDDPEQWCPLSFAQRREVLAEALRSALAEVDGVREVVIEAGTPGREYDFTAMVESDVGRLRTALWSHARAMIFCDPSIHPANRKQLAPSRAVAEAADRLRRRLNVRYSLESRGLTVTMSPEDGVERVWVAERSAFRNRTVVIREDRVANAASDLDLRDLLAHFYTGPSLRLVSDQGEPFLLPAAADVEGPRVSLCPGCGRWFEGSRASCPECGAATDVVLAVRPPRRLDR
ncbi:MAG TPA: hypothetical protein VF167_05055 [Longimicrobiaceae bacterium]